jgi:ABC-type amino acid transport system permease subunit
MARARELKPIDWRIEVKRAVLGIALGLLCVPALVFGFGRLVLGPFEGSIGTFLSTLYVDVLHGVPAAIALVVGPYALYLIAQTTRHLAERAGR